MNRTEIQKALESKNYSDLLAVFNHFKNDETFKSTIFRFDKFFNNAKPGNSTDIHFAMLRARVRDILRIMDQTSYKEREAEIISIDNPDIGKIKKLDFSKKGMLSEVEASKTGENKNQNIQDKSVKVKIVKNDTVNYKRLPAELKVLYQENGTLESEKKSLHAKMRTMVLKNQAKERQNLLLAMEKMEAKQKANWSRIDKWWNDNKTNRA